MRLREAFEPQRRKARKKVVLNDIEHRKIWLLPTDSHAWSPPRRGAFAFPRGAWERDNVPCGQDTPGEVQKRKMALSDNILIDTGFRIGLLDPSDDHHDYNEF